LLVARRGAGKYEANISSNSGRGLVSRLFAYLLEKKRRQQKEKRRYSRGK
jgi:hypothetical protein